MDFQARLSRLANVCVKVGVNVQPGQELIVTAPLEASAFVQQIARSAYQCGSPLVTCLYDDPQLIRDRFEFADEVSLDHPPTWVYQRVADALAQGAARLYVAGPYPDLLTGIAADKIVRVHRAIALASNAESALTAASRINWSAVPFVTRSWAKQVFPDLPGDEAVRALWDAVFEVTRVDSADPCAAWDEHNLTLKARREALQSRQFAALRCFDGRTDLTVGLIDGHRWIGGTVVAANGVEGTCNIPTEEVFTSPHSAGTEGHVHFSRPLALAGALVENLYVEFREGRVTAAKADRGLDTFEALIASDEGARRLGEIGLVPNRSKISDTGLLFYSALFDENAASHLAFGQSYSACVLPDASDPSRPDRGANQSALHIDGMFGQASMNVDGVSRDGHVTPIMRGGDFVI